MAAIICTSFAPQHCQAEGKTAFPVKQRPFLQKISPRNVAAATTFRKTSFEKKHIEFYEEQRTHRSNYLDYQRYAQMLKRCVHLKSLQEGKTIHACIIKSGFETDPYVGNCLVNMYAKCQSIEDARQVFDKMPQRNVVSWTAMLAGYSQSGHTPEAFGLFREMLLLNMELDSYIFGSIIKACASIEDVETGQQVHASSIKTGWELDVVVGSALVDMYCKSGSVVDARKMLDRMPQQDVVTWTAMISGYAKSGHDAEEALGVFNQMQLVGVKPNRFTYTSVLGICSSLVDIQRGKQFHAHIIKLGFETEDYVRIGLVDLYAKCGSMVDARRIFIKISKPDVVICTAMIGGYAQNGHGKEALKLFCSMRGLGPKPNEFTFANVLTACANIAALDYGKRVHALIIQTGFESIVHVGGALLDMYAKCGCVADARNVFDKLDEPSSVSCSAMIAGYAQNGHPQEALKLFCKLQQVGVRPSEFMFTSVLSASGSIANVNQGSQVHQQIIKTGFQSDVCVEGALTDMYANCGSLIDAQKVFDQMCGRDRISWTTMIGAYAQHGNGKEALKLFEEMQEAGIKPNHVTYVSVLSACSHAGLVDEGFRCFDSMVQIHGVSPMLQHYACIVDLLGRAGRLNEAEEFINKMPYKPSSLVWRTLLGACRIHGNVELGLRVAERILELDQEDDSTYVLLSNMYAAAGRQDKALEIRNLMKYRGVKKEPGLSWIQIGNSVHSFASGDISHPRADEIYAKLEELMWQVKEAGYIPQTSFLLHDVEEQN